MVLYACLSCTFQANIFLVDYGDVHSIPCTALQKIEFL